MSDSGKESSFQQYTKKMRIVKKASAQRSSLSEWLYDYLPSLTVLLTKRIHLDPNVCQSIEADG
ncbi:uncharacterized protein PHALS_00758 [Plasmopara halstedii]|uniref:Uncharacterized protein n=1 Tax=Plasmopara halstedii TaxID=4781 RepID=A0A0P1AS04_PLAHL|nr:uncharacterized protein PHALS_00758 [Plasmopara halstedii]CEG44390.1 hypothetical protein PHALS_00758 [Plasmopara halstedii]|eukprot:XP_024580759.1 hypothetical protein PHALS_00758 [Plasmopara halstedii]